MALVLAAAPAAAQGPAGPEAEQLTLADDPFEITDPHAAKPGEAELAIIGIYERLRRGSYRHTGVLQTEVQVGIAPGLDVRLGQLGAYGNLQTRGRPANAGAMEPNGSPTIDGPAWGGSTRLGVLYQVTDERGPVPLTAVLGRVRSVYGPGTPSYEGEVIALLGKTLGSGNRALGLNLNVGWTARFAPLPGERPNQYFFTAAIGQAVSRDTIVVLAYARRQQERGERDFSLVEIGIRHRIAANWPVLGFAVGAGTTRDTPSLQVSLAAQWFFGEATQ
jgi:hypothetical protein